MIENSCCKVLYEKCAVGTEERDRIQKARNALVSFYTNFAAIILEQQNNPDEEERKEAYRKGRVLLIPAVEGVKSLNSLCAEKGVESVFKGDPDEPMDVYNFAKIIVDEIFMGMQSRLGKKS